MPTSNTKRPISGPEFLAQSRGPRMHPKVRSAHEARKDNN